MRMALSGMTKSGTTGKPSVPSYTPSVPVETSNAPPAKEMTKNEKIVWGVILFLLFAGIIVAIVMSSMASDFTNPGKNELVFYHAGWCGYCREFLPVFDATVPELQSKFPGLVVTKYKDEDDREAIRKASPRIEGFPTVRMNGVEFEGPRTAAGLVAFVQANYQ